MEYTVTTYLAHMQLRETNPTHMQMKKSQILSLLFSKFDRQRNLT